MSPNRNAVGWFEIYVQDMDRARAFYERVFETKLEQLPGTDLEMWMFPMIDNGPGAPGALVRYPGKDSGGGGVIIYFSCADCAVEAQRAVENGGKLERPKFAIGAYGFISFVLDTEGNMIGLHSIK
jgi:uncharacterized protein